MELKRIKLSDIDPDENNPRKDFGDIHALARTFEANPFEPGQPLNSIVVVSDGDRYRIADGERRWRALGVLGAEECNAIVCGDYDEADSIVAMMATDDKEPLSEQERMQAVQRSLLLGVAPAAVEAVARLKRGQARKIAAVVRDHGDACAQSTIEQALQAYSLQESGASSEDVERVLSAAEEDWRTQAQDVRRRLASEEFRQAASALLEAAGFELLEESPEGTSYARMVSKLEDLQGILDKGAPEGAAFVFCRRTTSVDLYEPTSSKGQSDPCAKQKDALKGVLADARCSRLEWYMEALMPAAGKGQGRSRLTPNVDGLICRRMTDEHLVPDALDGLGLAELPPRFPRESTLAGVSALCAYYDFEMEPPAWEAAGLLGMSLAGKEIAPIARGEELAGYVEWAEAFVADGYEMDPAEAEFVELVRANLEPATDAGDGISGDDAPEPAGGEGEADPAPDAPDGEIDVDMLLDATAAELRIADEAAPVPEAAADAGASELDVASLTFDGAVV